VCFIGPLQNDSDHYRIILGHEPIKWGWFHALRLLDTDSLTNNLKRKNSKTPQ